MIMSSSKKNGRWIIPFKKFSRLRVKVQVFTAYDIGVKIFFSQKKLKKKLRKLRHPSGQVLDIFLPLEDKVINS